MHDWFMTQPCVLAAGEGRGLGYGIACVSVHQSYTEYAGFARNLETSFAEQLAETEAFLMNLKAEEAVKPFHFKYLAGVKAKNENE
jgi:hypothetical protein